MSKKIAIFIPSLNGGGAERVMISLANRFSELGYNVDLVVVKAVGPYKAEVSSKVRIVDLGVKRALFSLFKCRRYMKLEKPDSVISTMSHLNVIVILAKKMSAIRAKLIVREANTISLDIIGNLNNLAGKFLPFLLRKLYPVADYVVAPSIGVYDDIISSLGVNENKIKVIYNPVNIENIYAVANQDEKFTWYSNLDGPVILAVGRLSKQKNFSVLIESFSLVKKTYKKPLYLLVLGEGPDREMLENKICELGLTDNVIMPGFVDNPYWFMRKADVFVLSSLWEGLPNVLIQALSLNAPVVSTDCPSGPIEILEKGKWGKLVEIDDAEGMSKAIIAILSNGVEYSESSVRSYCENKFGGNNIAQQYLDIMF